MNTPIKCSLFSLVAFTIFSNLHAYNPFKDMQDSLKRMEEAFEKSFSSIGTVQGSLDIDLEEDKDGVVITVKNLQTTTIDATRSKGEMPHEGDLLIKTDQGTISIQTQENHIAVECRQKKQKDTNTFFGHQSLNILLTQPLDMHTQHLKLDYKEDDKTLLITIPFIKESSETQKRESLPVTIAKKKS